MVLVRMRGNGLVERGETNSKVLVTLSENTLFKALWPNKLQGWYARINKESLVLLENIPVKKVRTTKLAIELYVIHCKHIGDWTTEILLGSIEIYLFMIVVLVVVLVVVGWPSLLSQLMFTYCSLDASLWIGYARCDMVWVQ